jgi:hypothetical protein
MFFFSGVRNTDFLIFYDCANRLDIHCEFYDLLEPANSSYSVIVTFLTPNDRFLSNDFLRMLQRYEQVGSLLNRCSTVCNQFPSYFRQSIH